MTAMTALTMAAISNDRFILGLGTSGPQVVEGLQGRSFRAPLTRLKETVEIIKLAFAGERIEYHGKYHETAAAGRTGQGSPPVTTRQFQHSDLPGHPKTPGPRIYRSPVPWPMDGPARRFSNGTRSCASSTICAGAPNGLGAA